MIASCSRDKTIKIWDIKKLECIVTLKGHSNSIQILKKIDERTIVSGSYDETIKIWDIKKQKCISTLKGHSDWIESLIKVDENTIASGSYNGIIKIWDIKKQECISTLKGHSSSIQTLEKIDENTIVSGSDDKTIKIWDIKKQEYISTLNEGYSNSIQTLLKVDENTIASASDDKTIKIWDIKKQECISTLKGHSNWIQSLEKIDENTIVSSSDDKTIKIWDIKKQECIVTLKGHSNSIQSLVKIDKDTIASGSYDNTIKIWDIEKQECIITLKGHSDWIQSLVKIDENIIASGSDDNTINIWDIKKQECIITLKGHSDLIQALVKIDENTIASGSIDNTVKIWDISKKSNNEIFSIEIQNNKIAYEKNKLFVYSSNGDISTYNIENRRNPKKTELSFTTKSYPHDMVVDSGTFMFSNYSGDLYVEDLSELQIKVFDKDFKNRFHIKTLLLGDSGAGKTTIGYWLENNGIHNDDIHSTHAMRFFEYNMKDEIEVKIDDENHKRAFTFDLWDFGGQPEYQISHKHNFDNAKLILLVIDLKREANSEHYWINSIKEHMSVVCEKELNIFIVGTKSREEKDKNKLEKIKNIILNNIKTIDKSRIKTFLHDTTDESGEFNNELILEMEGFIKNDLKISKENILVSSAAKALEKIKEYQRSNFYSKNEEQLLEIINNDKDKEYDFTEKDIETALKVLLEYAMVERLDNYILLKPYWKNIFSTAILRKAQNNTMVKSSISLDEVFRYKFDVKFDELFEDEIKKDIKSDDDIFNEEFVEESEFNTSIKKLFMKKILDNFFSYKICYLKNGMLVFPSRFNNKPDTFDKKEYYAYDKLNLVSKRQVEITVGALVVALKYSNSFNIIKHLSKGVKISDNDNNLFLVEFSRDDILNEKKNQHTTAIVVYAKNSNSKKSNDNLVSFIKVALDRSLEPLYIQKKYILEKDDTKIGKIDLLIEEDYNSGTISDKEILQGINIISDKNIDNCFDKRVYENVEKNIKNDLKKIYDKYDNYEISNDINILHLSDLHFAEDTNIENELILLQKDFESKEKGLETISHIVLSGDLSSKGKAREFEKVSFFINSLIELCDIDAQKVMIVAGNHDYSRDLTHNAYQIRDYKKEDFVDDIDFKINDKIYLKRDKDKWDEKFKNFSEYLYENLYNQSFKKENYTKVMEDENISFVLLNTSKQIDHFNPRDIAFDTESFINVQGDISDEKIKIAVGHHPIDYEKSYDFINALHSFGYKSYIHGHVHRNNLISFQDMIANKTKLIQIASGLFYSKSEKSQLPGVPFRYNIISIDKTSDDEKKVTVSVETREREKVTMAWRSACLYPKGDIMTSLWDERLVRC